MMKMLKQMIDETKKGGKHRRQILQYLKNYPGATPYQITKAIYRSIQAGYKITKKHLDDFEKFDIVRVEKEDKKSHYYFTDQGEMLCKAAGLILPSNRAEEIIAGLYRYVREPLANVEIKRLRGLLTDDVLDTMEEVYKNFKWQKSADFLPEVKTSKELKKWFAIWFKLMKELEKKNLEKRKLMRVEKPELPNLFITSMAVLRWEFSFVEFQRHMDESDKFFENTAKEYAKSNKVPLSVAQNRLKRIYLEQQSKRPYAYDNYFVCRDFKKISCGYYLMQGNREINDDFIKLDEWLVGSFFKKCDPLVLDYVLMIGDGLERQLDQYGQMWALYELSKIPAPRSQGGEKVKEKKKEEVKK
jgi:predicted transcriptional regulator